jgi:hypothetical protein
MFERYAIVNQDDIADAMLKLSTARQRETEAAKRETEPLGQNFGHNEPTSSDFYPDPPLPPQGRN